MRISDWSSDVCSSDLADNDDHAYRLQNSQFGEADARALFALLRHWQPQRLIEVGSGYSTLLAADINRRFLDGAMRITAIEPYPRPFLRSLEGLHALRVERVQDTPASVFAALRSEEHTSELQSLMRTSYAV